MLINSEEWTSHEKDFEFHQAGMGTNSCMTYNLNDNTAHGYSAISDSWTEINPDITVYSLSDTGYVGLLHGYSPYVKYYTYNSYHDSWITLEPEGNPLSPSHRVGLRTSRRPCRLPTTDYP